MPSLRDLKKRLQSVQTTGQIAGAMRTVSTAKYSRIGSVLHASIPYSETARMLLVEARAAKIPLKKPASDEEEREKGVPLLVLVSGNRGLCGGYNHELFGFFSGLLSGLSGLPLIVACGRMAAEFCREKKLPVIREFTVSDVPEYAEAKALSEFLLNEFESGAASEVTFVFQRSVNMLKQEPDTRRFLPAEEEGKAGAEAETEFIPDAETVLGSQAATLMAMRAAYDNANKQAGLLETAINRRRQSEVTQSVLETSAEIPND